MGAIQRHGMPEHRGTSTPALLDLVTTWMALSDTTIHISLQYVRGRNVQMLGEYAASTRQ